MLVPFLLVGLLFGLQFALMDNERRSEIAQPLRQAAIEIVPPIPRCHIGYVLNIL
jgi:hypothetical protein